MPKHQKFLLDSRLAEELYEQLNDLPVIDFHTDLSLRDIYKNEAFTDLSTLWLSNDPEKWRLMRNSGMLEYQITGEAPSEEKFLAYARSLERAYLHPLHHWSHMELRTFFDEDDVLTTSVAPELLQRVNAKLADTPLKPRDVLRKTNVEHVFVNADLNDDLEFFKLLKDDKSCETSFHPIFLADAVLDVASDRFATAITMLEKNTATTISGITTLATALSQRLDYFNVNGGTVANHNISELNYYPVTKSEASRILKKRLMDYELTSIEAHQLTLYLLKFFLKEYAIRDMVCQLHLGNLHGATERMHQKLEENGGYDSISTHSVVDELNQFLAEINSHYPLPKMILNHANPSYRQAIASLCGNYTSEQPGKIQHGGSWWANQHEAGIRDHLLSYAGHLNLGTCIGMPSNAKSTMGLIRHDYARRILCNTIAKEVEQGRIPLDKDNLIQLVQDLSYYNRKHYFDL